jgi:energy-coupling factor transporter ATP-binding protein EcfA2
MKYETITEHYFKNLELPTSVQENLMGRLNLQLGALSEKVKDALSIKDDALATCKERGGKADEAASEWKKCEGECKAIITEAVNQEVGSTAFMLKLLADSVIRTDKSNEKYRLKIGLDPSFYTREKPPGASCNLLTGRWKEDAPFLHLVLPPSKQGRLIMGFGPSASGKTHWATILLGLLAQADTTQNGASFPKVFFSVDGGIVRESSAVYQFANEMAHCAGFAGFTNLHAGMFTSGDIKKTMEEYLLKESKRDGGSPISLYVPETLGKCEFLAGGVPVPWFSCEDYLKPFHEITRDKMWIGFLIWQHETYADHMNDSKFLNTHLNMKYKCAGCKASGKKREKEDGKPYDSKTYAQSMKNGRKYMEMAPGGRYEIHNAGCSTCISVLWDRSVRNAFSDRFSEIIQTMNTGDYKMEYVDKRSGFTKGVPKPRERNGYTPEGERMMANEKTRKATETQAKLNANAAATAAAAAADAADPVKAARAAEAVERAQRAAELLTGAKARAAKKAQNAANIASVRKVAPRSETHYEIAARKAEEAAPQTAALAAAQEEDKLREETVKARVTRDDLDADPTNPAKIRAHENAARAVQAAGNALQDARDYLHTVMDAATAIRNAKTATDEMDRRKEEMIAAYNESDKNASNLAKRQAYEAARQAVLDAKPARDAADAAVTAAKAAAAAAKDTAATSSAEAKRASAAAAASAAAVVRATQSAFKSFKDNIGKLG